MADPPRYPDTSDEPGDDTGVKPDRGTTTGLAPWQKVVGIIGLVVLLVIVLFVVLQVTGVGGHTPPIQHGMGVP
jgi:hypothetical protein